MSDEYRNNGQNGSLVNDSLDTSALPQNERDAATQNYPPPGDTTSSGGYGSSRNPFSPASQRGLADTTDTDYGAIQQSTSGTDIRGEIGDAKQGVDVSSRRAARADEQRMGVGRGRSRSLNPYNDSSWETEEEAREALGNRFSQ